MLNWQYTAEARTLRGRCTASAVLFVLGCLLGTLGTLSSPVEANLTYFWPAAALQTVSGIFFGMPGIVAGVAFPVVTNAVTDGGLAHMLGLMPASVAQCGLPALLVRRVGLSLCFQSVREVAIFVVFCACLPHTCGALLGCCVLWWLNEIADAATAVQAVETWVVGNVPSAAIFGTLLCWALLPVLSEVGLTSSGGVALDGRLSKGVLGLPSCNRVRQQG